MIIDVHGHVGPWFYAQDGGLPADTLGAADDLRLADTLRVMDRYGIDVQLVSGVEALTYDPSAGNAALARALHGQHRLRGLVVIDPRDLAAAQADLARLLPTGLFVGAKIHTRYSATPAGSAAMADALRLATDAGLPVLVHTWGPEILDLAGTVARVGGARVIAAHLAGPAWRRAPEAVARTDRLWLDPSSSAAEAGRVRWVLERTGPERVLFGTDATLVDPAVTLGALAEARLSQSEMRLIFSENARQLFQLDIPPDAASVTPPVP